MFCKSITPPPPPAPDARHLTVSRPPGPPKARSTARHSFAAAKALALACLLAPAPAALAQNTHTLPLVLPAGPAPTGFVRILNRSDRAGAVRILGIDDSGARFGPVTLSMDANETVNFNSSHLENGNESKGLSGGIGDGQGYWRLDLETTLDVEPLAYVRSGDGSLAGVHDSVSSRSMRHHVLTFNPGSNLQKRSLLRLVNTSGIDTDVVVTGLDDRGEAPPGGEVRLTLPADEARTLSAQALEAGGEGFEGSFGDGAGKWQVFVTAGRPIRVMSLLASPGNLVNLSAGPGDDTIRGGPGNDELFGSNGDDVLDPGDNDNSIDVVHGSEGDDRIVYTGNGPTAYQHLDYTDLGAGIRVTIDGAANRATVDKGATGTDTLVDVANPLNAAWTPPYGGLGIHGTPSADVFDLTLGEEQWMQVAGRAGADTFDIHSGSVRIDYSRSPGGVNVDLGAGRAQNDGYGDTDTINGRVWGVRGSDSSDVIVGSGNDETFKGRLGNDRIDGGGGFDRLDFRNFTDFDSDDFLSSPSSPAVQNLNVDLGRGTATGAWKGNAFSYRISNIEEVIGGSGNDILRGSAGRDSLDGGDGDDTITPGENDDDDDWVQGSAGNDRIVYTDSGGRSYQNLSYHTLIPGGITATIDGAGNRATVDKGAAGADTLVDIAKPLGANGFGLHGSNNADVFDLRLGDRQWMQVYGRAGDDTFNVRSGSGNVRISYNNSPGGIHVDLGAGRARNDGHGDTDTIRGRVREVRGSDFTDTIIGSGNDESFIGRAGNDTIDGGGGFDLLRFNRGCCEIVGLQVDLDAGTATGTWDGKAFSYRLSNIEWVRGSNNEDIMEDSAGDDRLDGRGGVDILISDNGGNDTLTGGGGEDLFTISPAGDRLVTITDFGGDDWVWLNDFNLSSHAGLLGAATDVEGGVMIDLSNHGGGRIFMRGLSVDRLNAEDFVI